MSRAFVFPGQGSQAVGMGKELADAFPVARAVFQEVDEALSQNLSQLMFDGPESELTLTANAQPALMAVSLAVTRVLESEGGFALTDKCDLVAGHSLGEYSALAAAGTFGIADAARLLKTRGQAMQAAVPVGIGAMAALLGLSFDETVAVAEAAAQGDVCAAANDNADGQVVVSGHKAAVERAMELAKEKGAKRAILLPVSAPFHCSLMQPAADAMAVALSQVTMRNPNKPLVANVTAQKVADAEEIRDLLIQQVCGTVRWRESVLYMKTQGVTDLVEIGAGKVLSGMVRRIDKDMTGSAINGPADIEAFLAAL
ncbi:ACP S-malonyltransferase [Thalassospira sp.]|uniref:ACP S-malonyltransferase n=1 Tax=Thalassospira sp. TaxID=1912094 RepID=UPI002735955D|nr:ACP S-malonyltransferase [Thalassospira sp.]MDP2700046.1 ACP S-malonyltransferase [Thalassospira sp.]